MMREIVVIAALSILLGSCQNQFQLEKIEGTQIKIDSLNSGNESLDSIISPYRENIETEMKRVLSYSPKAMYKTDTPYNTAIGNMMADAVLEMGNPIFYARHKDSIDAVLLNYGGIRSGINKGPITTRTAYDIMPFENMIVITELDFDGMKEMLEYLSSSKKAHPISNMKIHINSKNKPELFLVNGQTLDEDRTYFVATSDYLFNGGDRMDFFKKSLNSYPLDYKLRNLFIDYFDKHDTITCAADDRFTKTN